MNQHLRANAWLLSLIVLICCVLYPLVLLAIGQTVFRDKANGSLVLNKDGVAIGSRMIAQPFTADEYFHPRPSAASFNGAASSGSNLSANNPALRSRVEGMLGRELKYKDGRPVGPDIAAWARAELEKNPGTLAKWISADGAIPDHWTSSNSAVGTFLTKWQAEHPDAVAKWRAGNPGVEITPKDAAALFLSSFANGESKSWPETNGDDLQTAFFNVWWAAHPDTDVQPVPADMVTTSGSGLDPHITLDNALYQLNRVTTARIAKTKGDLPHTRQQIEKVLQDHAEAPLNGAVGVQLVNVLEVNVALDALQ